MWNGSVWVNAKLVNANVSSSAAIAYSKLNLLGSVVDSDVSTTAAIQASKLAGYPNDVTKALLGNGTWASLSGATTYRKVTTKAVNTTVTATDLLNGEVTVAAGALGTTKLLRLTAWGDFLQNSGSNTPGVPQLQVSFGGTIQVDTGAATGVGASTLRNGWRVVVEIMNLNATNVQAVNINYTVGLQNGMATASSNAFATGEGAGASSYIGSPAPSTWLAQGYGAGSIDTTAACALLLKVINASSNAAYETKLIGAVAEIV